MPHHDPDSLLKLHPIPWTVIENWDFGDAAPLSILDANGASIFAVAGHGERLAPTHQNDHFVAGALIQLAAAAPRIIDVLDQLLRWAEHMGGWDAPCWAAARALRDILAPKQEASSSLEA